MGPEHRGLFGKKTRTHKIGSAQVKSREGTQDKRKHATVTPQVATKW